MVVGGCGPLRYCTLGGQFMRPSSLEISPAWAVPETGASDRNLIHVQVFRFWGFVSEVMLAGKVED